MMISLGALCPKVGRASGHEGRRAVTKSRDEVMRAFKTTMNWNDERTLDEVEVEIVSPERSESIKPEGELTFRDGEISVSFHLRF